MVELLTLAAVGLLILGVAGSVLPGLPSGLLSLAGVALYAWSSGFAHLPVLVALAVVGVVATVVDYFGGAIAAGMGGASRWTVIVAAVVGVVLFVFTGPIGALLGLIVTVFVVEVVRSGDVRPAGKAAVYAAVGVLASAAVQLLLTAAILVVFLWVVL